MKKSILITLVFLLIACSTTEVEEETVDEIISETETTLQLNLLIIMLQMKIQQLLLWKTITLITKKCHLLLVLNFRLNYG